MLMLFSRTDERSVLEAQKDGFQKAENKVKSMWLPIFIISIPDATERRAPLISQLNEFNLKYELIDAVDFRKGTPDIIEPCIDYNAARKNLSRDILPVEIGCALSHHMIYRMILRDKLPVAIILEDDAILTEEFFELADSGLGNLNFDMLLLDHRLAYVSRMGKKKINSKSKAYVLKYHEVYCTTGYIINKCAAEYMIKNTFPLSGCADWPLDITNLNCYAAHPRFVMHYNIGESDSYIRNSILEHEGGGIKRKKLSRYLNLRYWIRKKEN